MEALSTALTVLSFNNSSASAANRTPWAEPVFERDHLALILPLSVLYVVIFVFGVLGNISTCIVIGRNRQMRTATNFYLFSLACSDLLLLISGLPLELHKVWFPYPYPFNEPVCVIQGLAAETSANATVLTILLFTCERYIAIVHPLAKHQARRRGGRLVRRVAKAPVLLSFVWIVALGLAIPQATQFGIIDQNAGVRGAPDLSECTIKTVVVKHAFLISTVVFFLGPVSIITCLYVRIAVKLRQVKRHRIRCTNQGQGQGHVFRILVAVVVTFFMCWAPFHAQRLIAVYVDPGDTPEEEERFATMFNIVTYISGVLYFMSTMINPILYHSMSNKFKEAFWDTIYRDFHGFNCITIPEHWKKKQESRYNTRRGQQDWRSRNGASGEQQASGRKRRQSSSMFELQPLGSTAANTTTTTSAIVSADAQSSLSARMGRSAVVDVNKLHTELYLNGGRSASGLPPLLRSQSMYSTPVVQRALWGAAGGARGPPPRRSRTVEVLDDTVRMQLSTKGMLLGRSEDGDDADALTAAPALTATSTARVAGMLTLELPVNRDLPQVKRAAKDALLDASALDAIVPYPATPSPPGSAPPSPAYVPLHSRSASPPASPTTPVYVVRGSPPDSPPYLPPRVVELYRKNEAVPEPGWV